MKTKLSILAVLLVGILCSCAATCCAQEAAKPQEEVKKPVPPPVPYHLEFALNEMQEGKKINSRHYTMNLNAGDEDNIRIGTKVPIEANQSLDVGTNIWTRLLDKQGVLVLQVRAEISNFALPEEAAHPSERPIVRQLSIHGTTVATLGRPMSIGSLDDPNSNHQFQLEVTVTRLN